jgi:antitoxin ParD1/3/4
MPTKNVNLTVQQSAFVDRLVKSGEYQNASEAVRDALRMLQQRRAEEAAKLKVLRRLVREGLDDLENGDYVELEDAELEGYFDELMRAATSQPGVR